MTTTAAPEQGRPAPTVRRVQRKPVWSLSLVLADRRGLVRLAVMALGIGLCALVLLGLSTVSPAIDRIATRNSAATPNAGPGPEFLWTSSGFASDAGQVNGIRLSGPADAPKPPGVTVFPRPGELVVSPHLAAAMNSDDGIRAVLPGTVVGTIDPASLYGPDDLYFYAGALLDTENAVPATGWGVPNGSHALDPRIWLVLVTGTVIVAVPLLLFIALAAKLGGARRDRRTATLRLLGASHRQVQLLAATEAAVASAVGLAIASAGFLVIRAPVASMQFDGRGMQRSDLAPTPVAIALIGVGVPALAIVATLLTTRVASRRAPAVVTVGAAPVRAWWRLALTALALIVGAVTIWQHAQGVWIYTSDIRGTAMLCLLVALTLFAVAGLTGLLVDRAARSSGRGSVVRLLARRRIAADGAVATRPAAALATVLAGTIALIALLVPMRAQDRALATGPDEFYGYVQLSGVDEWARLDASLAPTDAIDRAGITSGLAYAQATDDADYVGPTLAVGSCGVIAWYAPGEPCTDGDTFQLVRSDSTLPPAPYRVERGDGRGVTSWTPPVDLRVLDVGSAESPFPFMTADFVLTPRAAERQFPGSLDSPAGGANVIMLVEPGRIGEAQQAVSWLNARAAGLFNLYSARVLGSSLVPWASIGLLACGIGTLIIAGLGQWLAAAQQIGDRRRAFALARAGGVPAGALMRSVVLGWTWPAVLGCGLALVTGAGLAITLRYLRNDPLSGLPWGWAALCVAIALAVTVLIAVAAAWRLKATTGPAAIRTE